MVGYLRMSRAVVEHCHAKLMQRIVAASSRSLPQTPQIFNYCPTQLTKGLLVVNRLKFAKDPFLITSARSQTSKDFLLLDIFTIFSRVCREVMHLALG
jgi:hypothetical protein